MEILICQEADKTTKYKIPIDIYRKWLRHANYWNDRGYKVKPFSFYYTYGLSKVDKKRVIIF